MKKYLLGEGITDIAFVKYVCLNNGITQKFDDFIQKKKEYTFKDLVIINMDGQDNLDSELSFFNAHKEHIQKIAIIEDADDDFFISEEKTKNAIKKSGIESSKIIQFLTPNNKDLGDLETLLLSTIQKNNIVQCFKSYKECLTDGHEIYPKSLNKGQVYSYTMYSQSGKMLHKPHNSFMYKHDSNYKDTKLWDLSKPEFEPIVTFIVNFFKN